MGVFCDIGGMLNSRDVMRRRIRNITGNGRWGGKIKKKHKEF